MQLQRLQYQHEAIAAVIKAIDAGSIRPDENQNPCANPDTAGCSPTLCIDIKMETGTGKTYVYTRLMHELKQRFGLFKFIILVPGVAIKEGVKSSISADDWRTHFRQEFGNQGISLGVVNAGDFAAKGKRKQMPESLRSFCDASVSERNTINALLLNDAMLDKKNSMWKNDFDTTLYGSVSSPIEGLRMTKPIVIIDEPHRFRKENTAWKNIIEGLKPQLIFRFGATFPEKADGEKDYERLAYNLNSVEAFNKGLVKGVCIEYPEIPGMKDGRDTATRYKVKSIAKNTGVTFAHVGKSAEKTFKIGEDLSALAPEFSGISVESIEKGGIARLSNDLELQAGMELLPQVFSAAYQELLLRQAIDEHFAIEKANFHRFSGTVKLPRIKTNTLFFIDSVASFRGDADAQKGWLRVRFETLLSEKLRSEIAVATGDYKAFLNASLANMDATIAGYFAEDNAKKGDAALQSEVDDILRNKEQMLRFKNEKGEWNLRRFLFSKWTLREGWDNPNVFVICKLRTSGSEISKIQEVGRGLRLPFDENGNRMNSDAGGGDFQLSYIIDFSEREFARKLVGEINGDGAGVAGGKITDEILERLVSAGYKQSKAVAKAHLLIAEIINEKDEIVDSEKLFALLPDDKKLNPGKVTGKGMPQRPKIKLHRENFQKLKTLWEKVTRRYVLQFDKVGDAQINSLLMEIFANSTSFRKPSASVIKEQLEKGSGDSDSPSVGTNMMIEVQRETKLGVLAYGEFLKRMGKRTCLPVSLLHRHLADARRGKETPPELFNTGTLENIIACFEKKFVTLFAQKFSYAALDFHAQTSLFEPNGDFKSELMQGDVGDKIASDVKIDGRRYLYDKPAYDSEIEHEVLRVNPPPRVIVYGKLPRRSIKLPTYTGGTTSPDFVYAIRKPDGDGVELHLIVETKSDNPRLSDTQAVEAQEQFFKGISKDIVWKMETNAEKFGKLLAEMAK